MLDTRPPAISEVRIRSGRVEIELTEEVDPQSANSTVTIDGEPTTWDLAEDRYTLRSLEEVSPGGHTVSLVPGIEDLAGRSQPEQLDVTFPAGLSAHAGYRRPDPTVIPTTSAANAYGFHGHEADPATGLVYMRNRWYDPQMGRFVTADPLGYVDGPSAYGFAGGDPANQGDPMGLYAEAGHYYTVLWVALQVGYASDEAQRIAFFAQVPDEVALLDAKELWWDAKREGTSNKFGRGAQTSAHDRMMRHQAAVHALTGGVSRSEADRALSAALSAPDDAALGLQLHRLGDSFSHRELGNESKLYDTGFGHGEELNEGTSPDTIQRRPDLYLDYVKALAGVLSQRRGLAVDSETERAIINGVSRFAFRPSTDDAWYRWRNADNIPLEREAVDSLRALILNFGKSSGLAREAARILAYRPELLESSGRTVSDVFNQCVAARGCLGLPDSRREAAVEEAIKYSIDAYEATH